MSLLTTASPWNNNDSNKKRVPTMKKTMKKVPTLEKMEESGVYTERPTSFEEDQSINVERSERVNQLLDNMSSVLDENDGNKLADYNPLPLPHIQKKHDDEANKYGRNGDVELAPLPNHLQLQPPKLENEPSNFGPSGRDLGNTPQQKPYSNYRKIYEPTNMKIPMQHQPMRQVNTHNLTDNRLLEKINYMVHMLEQQQNEKTSNITEEFVLYLFLGVFIIFIVDSFARTGKYIR